MKPKSYRRGYPVALLIGTEENHATIWQIYSQVAKPQQTLPLTGTRRDQKASYNFHETIINTLRPTLKGGVKSIIIASPPRTNYNEELKKHITAHHSWMLSGPNRTTVSLIVGSASAPHQVATLIQKPDFKELIQENAQQETQDLREILEKRLTTTELVYFSLEEAEKIILHPLTPGKPQPEYLLLTNTYLANSHQKNRLNRLMQIAQNNHIKTRVINQESNTGERLTQLGGIVCLAKKA